MDIKELRIGNFIRTKGSSLPYFEIRGGDMSVLSYKEDSCISVYGFEPIPLTEEWLLKFGFVKYGSTMAIECGGIEIGTIANNKRFYIQIHTSNATLSIQYVHQLQNLYFALTGEELIITI